MSDSPQDVHKKALGRRGEKLAEEYLKAEGCKILHKNYRTPFGEADLIVEDKDEVAFVEVKTRTNLSVGLPREYVTRQKQEKLRRTAACYLAAHELDCPVRFDVAEVYTDTAHSAATTRIEYLEDAF